MAYNETTVLGIVKVRLNRAATDTFLDEHLKQRIKAADIEFTKKGITLDAMDDADMMLLADYTAWRYQNRDKPGSIPEWLRHAIQARWLTQERSEDDDT